MRDKNVLEKCILLKLLKEHPYITGYKLLKKLGRLQFSLPTDQFYILLRRMVNDGLIKKDITPKMVCGRNCCYYSLTNLGMKTLFTLEFRIQIALTISINGDKV